mmetsp:Transcript_17023/g.28765  ORF Transcript_17023/g.28765 Transcript_17023/m.28765 type:complete len:117 (-) Transcript_17023:64-414(-)
MWNQDDNEKNHIRLLLIITAVVDILWLMFWVPYYNDKEVAKWNYGLHMLVVFVSVAELVLKAIIFFMLFGSRADNRSFRGGNSNGDQLRFEGPPSQGAGPHQNNNRQVNIHMEQLQ